MPDKYKRFFVLSDRMRVDYPVAAYYFQYRICPYLHFTIDTSVINNMFENFVSQMKLYPKELHSSEIDQLKIYETMDYMKNQLLRDNDNIAMALGFESRSPLLSMQAFKLKPDNKRALKSELSAKNKIKFGKKRGFNLSEDKLNLAEFFYRSILSNNEYYHLISSDMLQNIERNKVQFFHLSKKIYILLEWFKANSVKVEDLNGLSIA